MQEIKKDFHDIKSEVTHVDFVSSHNDEEKLNLFFRQFSFGIFPPNLLAFQVQQLNQVFPFAASDSTKR